MRLNTDNSTPDSTSQRAVSNGNTTSPPSKTTSSTSLNGHSSHELNRNGVGSANGVSSHSKQTQPDYFGHDREEVTRILIQSLYDLGYNGAAAALTRESGHDLETSAVAAFRNAVIRGEWAEAELYLFGRRSGGHGSRNGSSFEERGMSLRDDADREEMLFQLRKQKFLELLETRDLGNALVVLRQELAPLSQDAGCLPALSSLMMCQSAEDLRSRANWDGANGQSRFNLLSMLSLSISPSVMIPEHRLAVLLEQVKKNQISECHYHNTTASPSLYCDHLCDRSLFPRRTVFELDEHNGQVWFLEFSHDGTRLATTGDDMTILIYETIHFSLLHRLTGHSSPVAHLRWSPDDSRIVSGSIDKTAKIWETISGKCLITLDHHRDPVTAIAWTPDGKSFVTAALDISAPMCLWNLEGELLHTWKSNVRIQDCVISPDGKRLVAITTANLIYVYDFLSREELYNATIPCQQLTCVTVSADSSKILINRSDNEVQILDMDEATVVKRFSGQQQGHFVIRSIFGGAGENFVVSGSEDSYIYIWHRENGMLLEKLEGHEDGPVNAVAWNPKDPYMFASAGDDHRVRIWGPEQPTPSQRWAEFSSNGQQR